MLSGEDLEEGSRRLEAERRARIVCLAQFGYGHSGLHSKNDCCQLLRSRSELPVSHRDLSYSLAKAPHVRQTRGSQ